MHQAKVIFNILKLYTYQELSLKNVYWISIQGGTTLFSDTILGKMNQFL